MIINKSLARVYSDIAAVQADTDNLQVQVGVAGAGLSAIPDMALNSTVAKEATLSAKASQASVDVVDGIVDSILVDTAEIGVAGAGLSAIPNMALNSTVAKEASLAPLALEASITALDAVVDAGFLAGAKSSEVDSLEANVGDASGHTLTSVVAKLGNDASTVKARLDAIDSAIAAIPTGWTSGESKGSFSYLIAGGEQTVLELVITDRKTIQGVWLDLVNAAQNGTIKVYYKVDGATYRETLSEAFTVASDSDGVYIDLNMGVTDDFKVTYTAAVAEAISIPYLAVWEEIQ